jgi:hypothetical protein
LDEALRQMGNYLEFAYGLGKPDTGKNAVDR